MENTVKRQITAAETLLGTLVLVSTLVATLAGSMTGSVSWAQSKDTTAEESVSVEQLTERLSNEVFGGSGYNGGEWTGEQFPITSDRAFTLREIYNAYEVCTIKGDPKKGLLSFVQRIALQAFGTADVVVDPEQLDPKNKDGIGAVDTWPYQDPPYNISTSLGGNVGYSLFAKFSFVRFYPRNKSFDKSTNYIMLYTTTHAGYGIVVSKPSSSSPFMTPVESVYSATEGFSPRSGGFSLPIIDYQLVNGNCPRHQKELNAIRVGIGHSGFSTPIEQCEVAPVFSGLSINKFNRKNRIQRYYDVEPPHALMFSYDQQEYIDCLAGMLNPKN